MELHIYLIKMKCIFLSWLTDVLNAGEIVTEVTAADKLEEIRSKQDYFAGLSFETIAGFGSNGAIIHYKAETQSCKVRNFDIIIFKLDFK